MATRPSESLPATPGEDEPFVHYYDQHPTLEDLMGESAAQPRLIFYLLQVLTWLFRVEGWFVINDLGLLLNHLDSPTQRQIAEGVFRVKPCALPEPS